MTAILHSDPPALAPVVGAGKRPHDRVLWAIVVGASALSIGAFLWFLSRGDVTSYKDSISHLLIARRIIENTSGDPSVAQLGGVWLPLPHLLMLPSIWVDAWFYSGFAGSVVSMVCYVLTAVLLYRTTVGLTHSRAAGCSAALIFALNPNVLYLQSTAMTELLLFACLAATVYYLQVWLQTGRWGFLLASATAAMLGSLSRYEAWILAVVVVVVVAVVTLRRRGYAAMEGVTLAFGSVALVGVGAWMLWNWVIFGSPLYFQTGEYAKPSLWLSESEPAVGDIAVSARSYGFAIIDNLGWPVVVTAVGGAVAAVVGHHRRGDLLAVASLMVFVPFFVATLYLGQRPMHVTEINGSLYNVRFGLVMILPAAVAVGYIVHLLFGSSRRLVRLTTSIAVPVVLVATTSALGTGIPTLTESRAELRSRLYLDGIAAATWLRDENPDGAVLMETFGNEGMVLASRLDLADVVNEGSYQAWEPALADPGGAGVDWLVMRRSPQPDRVFVELSTTALGRGYEQVYANPTYLIYERSSS